MSSKRKTNPPSAQLNLCPHVISQLLQDRLKLIESSFLPLLLSLPGVYSVFFWGLFSEQPITTLQTKNEMMMVFSLQAILLCFKNVSFYFCSYTGDGIESLDKDVPVSVLCVSLNTEFTGCWQLMVPFPKSSPPPPEWASEFWCIWHKIQPKYSLSHILV